MRTCENCRQKTCINSVIGVVFPACQDWKRRWGQAIGGIVVLVLMLIMLAVIVLSAIGDHVNTGRESWELRPASVIKTYRETTIKRPFDIDPSIYLQDTTTGRFEFGLTQEAVWYQGGQAHQVPTAWVRVSGDESPYTRHLVHILGQVLCDQAAGAPEDIDRVRRLADILEGKNSLEAEE